MVAATVCSGVDVRSMSDYVISVRDECKYNPWMMLPAADKAIEEYLPHDAHIRLSNKVRILLSRVSLTPPFLMAEIPSKFESREHLKGALRASCHVPFIGGIWPYVHKGAGYYDGMFWSSALVVPWRYFHPEDELVKVSAFGTAGCHIATDVPMPPWWAIFPPSEEVLRGMREQGYRDAARFFSRWESVGKNPAVQELSRKMRLPKDDDAAHRSRHGNPENDRAIVEFHEAVRLEWLRSGLVLALLVALAAVLLNRFATLKMLWEAHAFMMGAARALPG